MSFTYSHESEVVQAALNIMEARCSARKTLNSPADAMAYLRLKLAGQDRESFIMLTLDAQHRLIAEHEVTRGTHGMCQPFPRELLGTALRDGADFVIFCHNHPGGTALPSNNDCAMTAQMLPLFGACDIGVLDHVIVADEGHYSMAIAGVMGKLNDHAEQVGTIVRLMGERITALGI